MASKVSGEGDGQDTARFEIIQISPGKIKYMNPKFSKIQAKMYDYKCDIKLKVGNASFKAHRDVLAEASDYFSAMFSHDMLEKEKDVIELHEISPGGFTVILDYFYHGHVTIDQLNIEDVLEAARFFHVEFLVDACCDYLVHQLGMENYQNVLVLADKYWLGDLRSEIFGFLGNNIIQLSEENNFFENLDGDLLVQLVKDDFYIDAHEDFILFLVQKWVNTKPEERSELLLPLLRLIRFPLLDLETLETLHSSFSQFPEIQDAVEEAKHYNYNVSSQCLRQGIQFSARGAAPHVVMFSFVEGRYILTYKSLTSSGICTEELGGNDVVMEHDLGSSSSIVIGDFFFCAGGYDVRLCSSNRMFRFSSRTREWTELASMAQPRVSHASCCSRDRIFVLGGVDHQLVDNNEFESILASVEMYDIADNSWIPLPDLLFGSYDHAAAFHDNELYMTGGISADPSEPIPTGTSFKLSLGTESWEPIAGMLHPRQGHSITAHNNRLYVCGGYTCQPVSNVGFTDCTNNEMYDIETNQWTEITPTPPSFGHILRSVALYEDEIYFVGGGHLGSYDIEKDKFKCKEYFGLFIQKVAVMNVAYPSKE